MTIVTTLTSAVPTVPALAESCDETRDKVVLEKERDSPKLDENVLSESSERDDKPALESFWIITCRRSMDR